MERRRCYDDDGTRILPEYLMPIKVE